jgi:hypothetical protein
VTYEIVTEESAADGDAAERGFICEDVGLRDAIEAFTGTRTNRLDSGDGVEANNSQIDCARWFTMYNGMEYETGEYESRSIHLPDQCTASTRRRIARLLGVHVS